MVHWVCSPAKTGDDVRSSFSTLQAGRDAATAPAKAGDGVRLSVPSKRVESLDEKESVR